MLRRSLLALAILAASALGARAQCVLPYTLLPGAPADATQVQANFTALVACLGGSTGFMADGSTLQLLGSTFSEKPGGTVNASLANMAAHTYKGNNTGSTHVPLDVTAAQLAADIGVSGCPSIIAYGGAGDGTTDNYAPFLAALAVSATAPCVSFPPGNFKFLTPVNYTFAADNVSLSIVGSGQDVTRLLWSSSPGGITFNYAGQFDGVHVRDLSCTTSVVNGGTCLNLHQTAGTPTSAAAASDITRVTFRGADGYLVTDYWGTGVAVNGVSNVAFIDDNFYGSGVFASIGVDLEGTISLNAAGHTFYGSNFWCQGTGIKHGSYIQGLSVHGGNFVCGNVGIGIAPAAVSTDQMTVVGGQFELNQHAIYDPSAGVNAKIISSNVFITDVSGSDAINSAAGSFTINGNEFQAGTVTGGGVVINGGIGQIQGNNFVNQGIPISLGSGTGAVTVGASNIYSATLGSSGDVVNLNAGNRVEGEFPWTPSVAGFTAAGTPAYTGIRSGSYTRSHDTVTLRFNVGWANLGGATGQLYIGNIPFTAAGFNSNDLAPCNISYIGGAALDANYYVASAVIQPNFGGLFPNNIFLYESGPVALSFSQPITAAKFAGSGQVAGTCTYQIAP